MSVTQKKEKKATFFCFFEMGLSVNVLPLIDRVPSLKIFKAKQGRMVDALALSGEEGRGKLR